jgi:thioredoxin-like negative regulator of GroEL
MSFWQDEVINPALDAETEHHMAEQRAWIAREPGNPRPFYNLAQLYRMQWKQEEGLALLLHAVQLDSHFADAHLALCEIYAVRGDTSAAWRHGRAAEALGRTEGVALLTRHGVPDPFPAGG